uniref:Uncharacterized protein n=1 Tax=Anguilla anguilla TaxID=7936 RepID=A0A0E9SGR1_ANGAN
MIFPFFSESISTAFCQDTLYGRYSIIRGGKGRGEKMEGGRNGDGCRERERKRSVILKPHSNLSVS